MASRNLPSSTDSSQIIHVGLTPKQNLQIFEINLQKAKNKQAATIKEHMLRLECFQKESDTHIASSAAQNSSPLVISSDAP